MVISYAEFYPQVLAVDLDQGQYNHLFSVRDREGKDLMIAATLPSPAGAENTRVWIRAWGVACTLVHTTDNTETRILAAKTYLCTADRIEVD